ncbi:MAG TPA: hypothetical protein VK658_09665 [Chryseolinea sp.]|nr:hypothetical protein [Chryseolinea sp.]
MANQVFAKFSTFSVRPAWKEFACRCPTGNAAEDHKPGVSLSFYLDDLQEDRKDLNRIIGSMIVDIDEYTRKVSEGENRNLIHMGSVKKRAFKYWNL